MPELALIDWRDVLDIVLVAFLLYQLIQIVRGSRALAVVIGLSLLTALYFIGKSVGLYKVSWLLQNVFSSIFLVIVIIFQEDIRTALGRFGSKHILPGNKLSSTAMDEVAAACVSMAAAKIGALIVIERNMPLNDLIRREGVRVDARISSRLLRNIFYPKAPLHDGAVIISHRRIAAAACILPLAETPGQTFGTRHRAAIGISAESDALVVVVSEERGEISVAEGGELRRHLDAQSLRRELSAVS